mgnify:CR=1 FL=1
MKEKLTAKSYAQAMIDLAESENKDFVKELTTLTETINSNDKLENLLFLDVFTVDEKKDVLKEITKRLNLSSVMTNFLFFLLVEKRIHSLPSIFKEMILIDDEKKGFLRGTLESREESLDPKVKDRLVEFLNKKLNKNIDLSFKHNPSLTAGYRATVQDLQIDASLDKQLKQFKNSILN